MRTELKNNILQETSDRAHSMFELEQVIDQIQHSTYPLVENRLLNWFDFFNQHNSNPSFCFYLPMYEALIEASVENELFRTQTRYEFGLSKCFFKSLFQLKNSIVISNKVTALKVLILSIIYAKYPGMILNSPIQLFQTVRPNLTSPDADKVFTQLFVKYETPNFLIRNFEYLTLAEMEILMQGFQGDNLRKDSYFPSALTKREFSKLMSLDFGHVNYRNQILLRAAIISKFNYNENKKGQLSVFLKASNAYNFDPTTYFKDMDFWKRAFELITDDKYDYNFMGISDCVDFFEYKKYQEGQDYSLKGRTANSVSNAINLWHREIHNLDSKYLKTKWDGIKEPNIKFEHQKRIFECTQLKSGIELQLEGKALTHCVITYAPACAANNCSIWSLRKINKTGFDHILTLEISERTIVQARKKHNIVPNKKELEVMTHWAKRMEFEVDLYKNE